MKNNTFEELAAVLLQAEKILLYPHVNMDGDALGSCTALCRALRKMGKNCYVLVEDKVPDNLAFLDRDYCTQEQKILGRPDLSVCIDCGDEGRFMGRKERFFSAPVTMCIDHHRTTKSYCDYNYIDSGSAACAELIYNLLQAMGAEVDQEIGEALFTGITTDTGNFQYTNTTKKSHEIVAALYDAGIDTAKVSAALYENVRLEKMRIRNRVLETMSDYLRRPGNHRLCHPGYAEGNRRFDGRDRRYRAGSSQHTQCGDRRTDQGKRRPGDPRQSQIQAVCECGRDRCRSGRRRP